MSEPQPTRGQIWWVDLDPARGSETCKTRPAVVVSIDAVSRLPVRLVVPLTEWKEKHREYLWRLEVEPSQLNGLTKTSAADALQIRCVSLERFEEQIGRLEATLMSELCAAVALVVEYE
ncbi:MAG: type II toxin-antitoxin system PemK/MazF family toxin [Thermoanaerobaculales bacterium]